MSLKNLEELIGS